jgi:glycosyltransferase involved in cell wall biosynthesis
MTLAFYPRGGSAQVVRYLARGLEADGTAVTICSGSLGPSTEGTNAGNFFAGLDVVSLDFTAALARFEAGLDPMTASVPIHPSFEDRQGAPDRVFAAVDDSAYLHQVEVWEGLLASVGQPDLYHAHHLTHVNAAFRIHDDVPVIAHLHGTELKMLRAIADGPEPGWDHAEAWRDRLIEAAWHAAKLVVISPSDGQLAVDLLGVDPGDVGVIPNGVDVNRFAAEPLPQAERAMHWRKWLVEEPLGWDESGVIGSVTYTEAEVAREFHDRETGAALPVFIFVGRFLGFKRVPLLVRAYAQARAQLGSSAPPLVVWGGHPGEWEGEHPYAVATSLGVDGVFFSGWRGHHDLAAALNCADVLVAPSVDEPFGQVYLEAMASGLAVIGTNSGGPPSFVNTDPDRPDGWLVTPDSTEELATAMVEAAAHDSDRERRGAHGRLVIERDFDWRAIARRVNDLYRSIV